jgi:hypothetical protein
MQLEAGELLGYVEDLQTLLEYLRLATLKPKVLVSDVFQSGRRILLKGHRLILPPTRFCPTEPNRHLVRVGGGDASVQTTWQPCQVRMRVSSRRVFKMRFAKAPRTPDSENTTPTARESSAA